MKGKLAIIAAAVLIGTAGTYILNENTVERDTVEIQQEIAQKILRFHVLANSDSEEDQALKLKVKEGVTGYLDQYLNEDGMTLDETKEIVEDKKEDVIVLAQEIIRENGYDYSVTAELTTDYFPVKSYGDVTLPAGEYEAFRIKIGEAEGKNSALWMLPMDMFRMLPNRSWRKCLTQMPTRPLRTGELPKEKSRYVPKYGIQLKKSSNNV
mgnify:CR=1 FL=1